MKKFRRFLGKNSAETCLKVDYFGSISPKIAKQNNCRQRGRVVFYGDRVITITIKRRFMATV